MSSIFWSLPSWLAQDKIQASWWALDPLVGPVDEPVTINDVKIQARADGSSRDDVSFAGLLSAARMFVEKYTNRSLLPQSWMFSAQIWPSNRIFLPRAPLISLDSFEFTNIDETTYSVDPSTYDVNLSGDPGSVVLRFGQIWPPDPLSPSSPIKMSFTAGYPRFSGSCIVDPNGVLVTDGTSPGGFNPAWTVNTWIALNGKTSLIARVISPGQLILAAPRTDIGGLSDVQWSVNLVPQPLKLAIMMLATHWYAAGRTPVITGRGVTSADISLGVKSLMNPYRINVMGFSQINPSGSVIWA